MNPPRSRAFTELSELKADGPATRRSKADGRKHLNTNRSIMYGYHMCALLSERCREPPAEY